VILNADGNFNWEQMVEKDVQRQNDVALHDGEGFLVESKNYEIHRHLRSNDILPVSHSLFSDPADTRHTEI
jgi:hypothetical protein